jgi:hypothetical protein
LTDALTLAQKPCGRLLERAVGRQVQNRAGRFKENFMDAKRGTNALLIIIAICLVLIVARLYEVNVVQSAEAQQEAMTKVYGCYEQAGTCKWLPIHVDKDGYLVTKPIHQQP